MEMRCNPLYVDPAKRPTINDILKVRQVALVLREESLERKEKEWTKREADLKEKLANVEKRELAAQHKLELLSSIEHELDSRCSELNSRLRSSQGEQPATVNGGDDAAKLCSNTDSGGGRGLDNSFGIRDALTARTNELGGSKSDSLCSDDSRLTAQSSTLSHDSARPHAASSDESHRHGGKLSKLGPFRTPGAHKSRTKSTLHEALRGENFGKQLNPRATPHVGGKARPAAPDRRTDPSDSQELRAIHSTVHSRVRHSYFQGRRKPRSLCDSKGSAGANFTSSTGSTGAGAASGGSGSIKPILAHRLFAGSGSFSNSRGNGSTSGGNDLAGGSNVSKADRTRTNPTASDSSNHALYERSRRSKFDSNRTSSSSQRSTDFKDSPQKSQTSANESYSVRTMSRDGSSSSSEVETNKSLNSPSDAGGDLRAPTCPRVSHKYRQKTAAPEADAKDPTCASSGSPRGNVRTSRAVSSSRRTATEPARVVTTGRGLSILTPKGKKTRSRAESGAGREREHRSKTPLKCRSDVNANANIGDANRGSANDDSRERWRTSSAWQAQRSLRANSDDTVSTRFAGLAQTPRHSNKRSNSEHILSRDRGAVNSSIAPHENSTPRRPENRKTSQNTLALMRSTSKRDSSCEPPQVPFESCNKENGLSSNHDVGQLVGRSRTQNPLAARTTATESAYQRNPARVDVETFASATPLRFSGRTLKYAAGFSTPGHRLLAKHDDKDSRAFGQDITRTVLNHKSTNNRQSNVLNQLSSRGTNQYRSARRPLTFN